MYLFQEVYTGEEHEGGESSIELMDIYFKQKGLIGYVYYF